MPITGSSTSSFTLKIDGNDFWPFIRVAPGEGFDPTDSDFREPQFGDSAIGVGDPLLNIAEHNREMAWPVHITTKRVTGYAQTKDGLHLLVADVNRVLAAAVQVEWKDDSSTKSSYFDVQFARFEPEYNFRRSQGLYVSGVVRIFVKPYATTGTFTSPTLPFFASQTILNVFNVGSIAGDMPAYLKARAGNDRSDPTLSPGAAYGVAVVPSGYIYDTPAASFVTSFPSIILKAATAGMGNPTSANNALYVSNSALLLAGQTKLGHAYFSPASMYEGRNRVLALISPGGDKLVQAFDDDGHPLTAKPVIATGVGMDDTNFTISGYNLVDLGVLNVPHVAGRATAGISLSVETPDYFNGNPLVWDGSFTLNRIIMVPDDRLFIGTDYSRRLLGWDRAQMQNTTPSGQSVPLDQLGNPYAQVNAIASNTIAYPNANQTIFIPALATAGYGVAAMKISHPTCMDLHVDANCQTATGGASGMSVSIGKYVGGTNDSFTSRLHYTTSSGAVLNLISNGIGGPNYAAATMLASKSVASVVDYVLSFSNKGSILGAMIRTTQGSLVATLAASHAGAAQGGQTLIGFSGTSTTYGIRGFVSMEAPSIAASSVDFMEVDGYYETVFGRQKVNYGNNFSRIARGAFPLVESYDNVLGMNYSLDGGSASRSVQGGASYMERFTYAR